MNKNTLKTLAIIAIILGLFMGGASDTESGQLFSTLGGAGLFTLVGIAIHSYVQGRKTRGTVQGIGE